MSNIKDPAHKLLSGMTAAYNIVYLVNTTDDSFKLLRMDDFVYGKDESFPTFSQAKSFFFTRVLHPWDKERMQNELDYGTIRQRLTETKSYDVEYRAIMHGECFWYEMNVTYIDEDVVAIGFVEADRKLMLLHLQQKRYDDYFALYMVDVYTETIKVIKQSPWYNVGKEGEFAPYKEQMQVFASTLDDEPKAFFMMLSDIETAKRNLKFEDKFSYTYRSCNIEGCKWVVATCYVTLRQDDGTPAEFSMGWSLADSLVSSTRDAQQQIKEDMQMIGGLASEYHALYYFNIKGGFFKIYSIDEQRFPEAKHLVIEGGDPLATFRKFGASGLVHPDDKALFDTLSVEKVREKLAHSKKFTTRFRRRFGDEYFWTDMEFIKYEDIDEEANVIALGFAERDAEIRSEQTLNSCFAILGKEISPDEAINQLKALAVDYYGASHACIFSGPSSKEVEGLNMIYVPIKSGDEKAGYIGVVDPKKAKDNIDVLKNIAVVVYSEILKQRQSQREEKVYQRAILNDAYSYFRINLSKNKIIPPIIEREHGLPVDYTSKFPDPLPAYDEIMALVAEKYVDEADKASYRTYNNCQHLIACFNEGNTMPEYTCHIYSTTIGWHFRKYVTYLSKDETSGDIYGMCVAYDVSQQHEALEREKQYKAELAKAMLEAQSANKSKTSFLFNMSHDIRTPMNAISGFTAMAKKYINDPEKVTDYLNKIDLSGQQLLMLINQVLEMSRIESGRIELNEDPVNIHESYDALVTILSEQAKDNDLEFHHSICDIKHNVVLADDARMSQITLNITGNAIKYTPKGGRIDFSLRENPKAKKGYASYTFTVVDTGIGMSREFQRVLFEPFSRESNSTVSKIQGTGLGMSIVKSLVDLMGGTITVDSELGKGTRFDVTIELKLADEGKPKAVAKPVAEHNFSGRRVLLVEDNDLNREIAKFILEDQGLFVDEAEDGDVAVQKMQKIVRRGDYHYYDFILMDVQMPRMNGYEATAKIREIPAPDGIRIPIIALSANAFEEDKVKSRAAGMDDHIAKPIDLNALWSTLAKYL